MGPNPIVLYKRDGNGCIQGEYHVVREIEIQVMCL